MAKCFSSNVEICHFVTTSDSFSFSYDIHVADFGKEIT